MSPRQWLDMTIHASEGALLSVTNHVDTVSLSIPGYSTPQGMGVSIYFTPRNLQALRQLVTLLEALDAEKKGEESQALPALHTIGDVAQAVRG